MINKLLFQNIKVAWRNLMKYKVQNIIAVLCLAVGLVCFSVGFIVVQRLFEGIHRAYGDPRRQYVEIRYQDETCDTLVNVNPQSLKFISEKHLSSIEYIELNYDWLGTIANYFDLEGKTYPVQTEITLISPEHLNYLGLRSAITGKRIPVLKPGDIVMTKGMLERTFGKDVNPIGYTTDKLKRDWGIGVVSYDSIHHYCEVLDTTAAYGKIIDVVDTGDWILTRDNLLVVSNLLKEFENEKASHQWHNYLGDFTFILAKGKTADDLLAEMREKFPPEYKVTINPASKGNPNLKYGFIGFLILAASILLIGLFGFLKMQIQLFRLRQREMGLRQCMGAQRHQLFSLLMWEVAFVFFFVTLLTLGLTSLLADFAIPIILKQLPEMTINMPLTYTTELWICLIVFLLTVGIALLSVRRVVTKPLSEVVGKSQRTSTRGRNLLITLQMVVCITFLSIAFSIMGEMSKKSDELPTVANTEAFQNCIVSDMHEWQTSVLDSMPYYQNVANFTSLTTLCLRQDLKDGEMPPKGHWEQQDRDNNNQRFYTYQALITDEHLFEMLDLEVQPTATEEEISSKEMIPIYVSTERAAELRQKLGVKAPEHPQTRIVEKGKEAECVGYFRGQLFTHLLWADQKPAFLYVTDRSYFAEKYYIEFRMEEDFEDANSGWSVHHYVVVQAKQGQYEALKKELTEHHRELGRYTVSKAPLDNFYDVCFKDLRMLELITEIVAIMCAIALLCIVLTLFSSVSLDVRGRQKEVAIRKAHGASQGQIIWLFGRGYVYCLIAGSIISLLLANGLIFLLTLASVTFNSLFQETLLPIGLCSLFVALITLLTVGYKIYKVSKLNPATIIKKE